MTYLRNFSLILGVLLLLIAPASCQSDGSISGLQIIPQPRAAIMREGKFLLKPDTKLIYPKKNGEEWALAVKYFQSIAAPSTGYQLKTETYDKQFTPQQNTICFVADDKMSETEGYVLEVQAALILIKARTAAGAFYAVQSLRQLFPAPFNGAEKEAYLDWAVPCCSVADAPRFEYRGLHLDVGRHFFSVNDVKRYIDLLAMHKLNTFHWHLTEDQGWRIEIKKYPALQTVAACRKETLVGHYSDLPQKFDGKEDCGYYTQEEVKSIVAYAKERFVTIVPEIEMPGHAQAALAAYPELGCTGGPYAVAGTWGVFDDVFCAGNDKTFEFISDVLDEVCALFPGQYVHVGGDECPKERWKVCPKCQKRMKDEKLADEHALQSYFIARAEKMLEKHGKKLIGWDEILEGGLAPNATVMSWRGIDGGIAAAKQHHNVIMTPTSHVYFDYYQSDPATEPLAIGGYLTLEKVYSYEPVPTELSASEAKYIIGTQGNLWTEYIPNADQLFYMTYPRACALAEVAWSDKGRRSWADFSNRMRNHFSLLDVMKVPNSKAMYDLSSSFAGGKVNISAPDKTMQVHYTIDGTEPTAASSSYKGPFKLEKSAVVKAAPFMGNKKTGKVLKVEYLVHKASGKSYTMPRTPDKYTGGETYALTNGVVGGLKSWNNWVALVNHDIDPTIDFETATSFSKVSLHYVNSKTAWIYPPTGVELLVSDNGKDFRSVGQRSVDAAAMSGSTVETVSFELPKAVSARYLKVVVKTFGVIPEAAPGAGNGAWLFVDEVVVE
jgi:hexosaminidase